MASWQAKLLDRVLFLFSLKPLFADREKFPAKLVKRRCNGPDVPNKKFLKRFDVSLTEEDGYPVYTVRPKETSAERHILFLHGGGYVLDMTALHWGFLARLIEATGAVVSVPIYALAPEQTCDVLIPKTAALYDRLIARYGAGKTFVMGDSAGAGLTLSMTHYLRDHGKSLPVGLVLLSPWLDGTGRHPEQPALEKRDRILSIQGLEICSELYAGDYAVEDPMVSPLFGEHHDLPPLQIFTGTSDILWPDARRFRDVLTEAGNTTFEYHEYADMPHDWMLINLPESRAVTADITTFMQTVCP